MSEGPGASHAVQQQSLAAAVSPPRKMQVGRLACISFTNRQCGCLLLCTTLFCARTCSFQVCFLLGLPLHPQRVRVRGGVSCVTTKSWGSSKKRSAKYSGKRESARVRARVAGGRVRGKGRRRRANVHFGVCQLLGLFHLPSTDKSLHLLELRPLFQLYFHANLHGCTKFKQCGQQRRSVGATFNCLDHCTRCRADEECRRHCRNGFYGIFERKGGGVAW